MLQIPLAQIPAQTFYVVLADQNCTISIYWRQKRLYLDLMVDNTLICEGAICQNRVNILQSPTPLFSGSLYFYDLDGDRSPDWEFLHTGQSGRWVLVYFEAGETAPEALGESVNGS